MSGSEGWSAAKRRRRRSASSARRRARRTPSASISSDGLAQPGGVGQGDRDAAEVEPRFDHVPRGARPRRDDRRLPADQRVQEGRLAGIGRPEDRHHEPLAQAFAPAAIGEVRLHLGPERRRAAADLRVEIGREVLGFELDEGFLAGEQPGQPLRPTVMERGEAALGLLQGLPALGSGFGGDQVGNALGGGEVQLAVDEGAAGELARLGGACARRDQRLRHAGDHGRAAMEVQLGAVLAGVAAGRREPEDQGAVERLARIGVAQSPQAGRSRRGQRRAGHAPHYLGRAGARQAHHGDRRPAGAGGEGEDHVE